MRRFGGLRNVRGKHVALVEFDRYAGGRAARKSFDTNDDSIAFHPDILPKGSEHELRFNPEQSIVDQYDGKLLFSSGEMRFMR